MKILSSIVILGLITASFNVGCNEKKSTTQQIVTDVVPMKEYNDKRLKSLNQSFLELEGIEMDDGIFIYGIMMDWNLGKGQYVTITAYQNGRAFLYTSDSTKDIDIQHENIKNAVRPYIELAMTEFEKMQVFTNDKLPQENHFKFYFLTNLGTSEGEGYMADIIDGSSKWAALFDEANKVIIEIRNTYYDFAAPPE